MGTFEKITRRFIYRVTKKPECYIHIDKPKTLQDYRQLQYNKWCKSKGVYNGAYLPENPDKLKESGKKGWREITCVKDKTGKHRTFIRKSSSQVVDYHDKSLTKKGILADEHYHWYNPSGGKKDDKYKDRYGKVCANKSLESHLAPLDKDYNYK